MKHFVFNLEVDIVADDEHSALSALDWMYDHGASGDLGGFSDDLSIREWPEAADLTYEDDEDPGMSDADGQWL